MAQSKDKRLEVYLPIDHPLFSFPRRSWAPIAREWLDIGMQLKLLRQEIGHLTNRVRALENRIKSIPNGTLGVDSAKQEGSPKLMPSELLKDFMSD